MRTLRLANVILAAYRAAKHPARTILSTCIVGFQVLILQQWILTCGIAPAHIVPQWYQTLVPITGQNPTPSWDITTYLSFMASEGISHSVIGFSAPGPNVYQGNKKQTLALARLMNEQVAAYCRTNPEQLSFYAVVPLPYTAEAISEANYALDNLGAVGIVLTSNVEGLYLGNAQFTSFFDAINKREGRQILYIHPGTPYLNVGGTLYEANPTHYATGNIEF